MRATWLRKFGVLAVFVLMLCALLVPAASASGLAWSDCPTVYHRIVRGENLSEIAARYGVTVRQVMNWNDIVNPDRIYWGFVLTIYPNRCAPPAPRYSPPPVVYVPPQPVYQPPPPCVAPACVPPPCVAPACLPSPCVAPACAPPPVPVCVSAVCQQSAACPDQRSSITYPYQGQSVSGMVTISGNATVDNFSFYKLEYGAGSNPSTWSWFFGGDMPVWHGTLGALNTSTLASGTYTIRLTVVDKTSNYPPPCQVTIVVR